MKLHVCLTNSPGTESLLRILNIAQLIKKFPAMLARTRHWILFWARWTQSISSHHISLRKILILPSHRRVKLQSGARIFLKDFATKMFYELLISLPPPRVVHTPLILSSIIWSNTNYEPQIYYCCIHFPNSNGQIYIMWKCTEQTSEITAVYIWYI